jgi:hypothetical protein
VQFLILRFACPFFKRDPRKYRHCRGCTGPGWHSVHRLKYFVSRLSISMPRIVPVYVGTFG